MPEILSIFFHGLIKDTAFSYEPCFTLELKKCYFLINLFLMSLNQFHGGKRALKTPSKKLSSLMKP